MTIHYLEKVDSTQKYLKESLKNATLISPIAVCAKIQTNGQGSRGNSWIGQEGNLFFSFALPIKQLPKDLKLESASIYFAYILKDILAGFGSKLWMKWPNDFYLDNFKIGGVITNIVKDDLVCGIGLNIANSPQGFAKLDIQMSTSNILESYFNYLEKQIEWKQIFSKYELEFYKSQSYEIHSVNGQFSLDKASLQEDGSIVSNGQRIFSLR